MKKFLGSYTSSLSEGYITLSSPPSSEDVSATFMLDDEAPTRPEFLHFFTFEDVLVTQDIVDGRIPDVTATFDPADGVSVMEAVYESIRYILPSYPTTLTFIDEYNEGWSRDCDVTCWLNVTKNRIVGMFRVEPSPDPVAAYFVPLYIGRLTLLGREPRINNIILGGSNEGDKVSATAAISINDKLLDYGQWNTTGNESVQLQQSIGGSLYNKHFISFITHDPKADLSPESRFSPSVYTDKYHISPMYVVHPHDGFVGMLDEVYAVHPKNISQLDELIVKEKTTNELIGIGDGKTKVFHTRHTPKADTLSIKIDCIELSKGIDYSIIETQGNNETDEQLKSVTFNVAPAEGKEIYADYEYDQTYTFLVPTTPETPLLKDTIVPYAPIGLGILKYNYIED